jgi:hypothetical protein
MKHLLLVLSSALLLVGCATNPDVGGTATPYEVDHGVGTRDYPVQNDLDDLGYQRDVDNQKPDGQRRVPGRSIDVDEGPL